MKLVAFADLHLDTPFTWATNAIARQRRQGLRDTMMRVIELAASEQADALICSGDLYEQERFSRDTGEFLRAAFERLHPMPVFIAPGNHDWLGPPSLYSQVTWSPNVQIFRDDRLSPLTLAEGFTVWGAAHRAPRNTDGFLDGFRVDRGSVNVAAFHGSERSGLPVQGEGKIPHAPFDAQQIEAAGLDFALVGHYHTPRSSSHYVYPGNPDPLSFGEEGERGAVIAEFAADGTVTRHTLRVASATVFDLAIDVTGCTSSFAVRERVAAALTGRTGIARVTISGELGLEVEIEHADIEGSAPWMDAVVARFGTLHLAFDIDAIAGQPTVEGRFVADVLASGLEADQRRRVLVTGLRAPQGRSDLEVL
jgi:DNA repair exonuclease SbcCD nuclease subunit